MTTISLKCPKCGAGICLGMDIIDPGAIPVHCVSCGFDRVITFSDLLKERAIMDAARILGAALDRAMKAFTDLRHVVPAKPAAQLVESGPEAEFGPRTRLRFRDQRCPKPAKPAAELKAGEEQPRKKRPYHRHAGGRPPGRPKSKRKRGRPKKANVGQAGDAA